MSQRLQKEQSNNSRRLGAEILVFAAIALIAAAVWFGLVLHAGLTTSFASSGAFATFVGLGMLLKLFRRSQQTSDMQAEIDRLQSELSRAGTTAGEANISEAKSGIKVPRLPVMPGAATSRSQAMPPIPSAPVMKDNLRAQTDGEQTKAMARRMDGVLGRRGHDDGQAPTQATPSLPPGYQSPPSQSPTPQLRVGPTTPALQSAPDVSRAAHASPPSPPAVAPRLQQPPSQHSESTGPEPAHRPDGVGGSPEQTTPGRPPDVGMLVEPESQSQQPTPSMLTPTSAPAWQEHAGKTDVKPYLPNVGTDELADESAVFDAHFSPADAPGSVPPPATGASQSNIREVDVKKVHGLIKKLAEQVNAVEALSLGRNKHEQTPPNVAPMSPELHDTASPQSVETATNAASPPPTASEAGAPSVLPHVAAGASVAALNTAADTMRTFEPPMDLAGDFASEPTSVVPDEQSSHNVVVEVSDAIASGRMNILLSPIHGLRERKAQHYEISIALHDAAGAKIDVTDPGEVLRGTALLPALDSARLVHTAQIGEQLVGRGYTGVLFSDVTGEALDADQFLNAFADAYQAREAFASQLVIVFQQSDVRQFGDQAWATLYDMQHLGFRFALAGVTDLDMDFVQLKSAGFTFVKLSSAAFLHGLPALGRQIQASDVCQHLGQAGLTLVVDGITSEEDLAKIFGFGVLFGQGELFGGARAVRSKSGSSSNREAAA